MNRRIVGSLLVAAILYLLIGSVFIFARANSHYKTIVVEHNVFFEDQSYWEARCIPENNQESIIYGTPGAIWCVDGFGNFHTQKPTRFEWFYIFYSQRPFDVLLIEVAWPLHLLGVDLIHFKSVAGVWQHG